MPGRRRPRVTAARAIGEASRDSSGCTPAVDRAPDTRPHRGGGSIRSKGWLVSGFGSAGSWQDAPRPAQQRPPVTEHEVRQTMTGAHRQAGALTRSDRIAQGLEFRRRYVDRLRQPGGTQTDGLARIAPVCLDPLTRSRGHQRRRHRIARDPALAPMLAEPDPRRCRLMAAASAWLAGHSLLHQPVTIGQRYLD
jgi:hypothetical protein